MQLGVSDASGEVECRSLVAGQQVRVAAQRERAGWCRVVAERAAELEEVRPSLR